MQFIMIPITAFFLIFATAGGNRIKKCEESLTQITKEVSKVQISCDQSRNELFDYHLESNEFINRQMLENFSYSECLEKLQVLSEDLTYRGATGMVMDSNSCVQSNQALKLCERLESAKACL